LASRHTALSSSTGFHRYNGQCMDEMDNIHRRLTVCKLQARRELFEIDRDALVREMKSPLTSRARWQAAFVRREQLVSQWTEV